MTDVLTDVLWVEKYRPQALTDVALEPDTRQVLQSYVEAGEIPHLLFVGPPGSGKTTLARILLAAVDCQVLGLNASSERGIDTVRDKISSFVRSVLTSRWNIVFLDEADQLTPEAQTSLRNVIENFSDRSRFIFTANAGHKIIPAIKSRCQEFIIGRPPLKERWRILTAVLAAEGIEADPKLVLDYAERYPDMRKMLMATQKAYLSHVEHSDDCAIGLGSGCNCPALRKLPPVVSTVSMGGDELFALLVRPGTFGTIRDAAKVADFVHQQALIDLFWAVPDDHPKAGFIRYAIGSAINDSGYTVDPVTHFLAVISNVQNGLGL